MEGSCNRREFLHRLALFGGALAVSRSAPREHLIPAEPLPKRVLGRTGARIPVLGLGLGPLGIAGFSPEELQAVVEASLEDWGTPVLVDVQWNYGDAEIHLAPLLKRRRTDIFIVIKTWEQEQFQALMKRGESLAKEWGQHLGEV